MQPIDAGIAILVLHGLLVVVHSLFHPWSARLAREPRAAAELKLHAGRSALCVPVFAGLAWFEWHGAMLVLLGAMVIGEFALALVDSVVEAQTREVLATEQLAHMALGVTTGAWVGFVFYTGATDWWMRPTGMADTGYGVVSWLLTAYAFVLALLALRDAITAGQLERQAKYLPPGQRAPRRRPVLVGE